MRSYRFKQLAVQLPAAREANVAELDACGLTQGHEPGWPDKCGFASPHVRITDVTIWESRFNPAELAILREVLRRQLTQVEELERAHKATQLPATLEETTQLEQQMSGALEELRAHRAQLQHQAMHHSAVASDGTATHTAKG